MTEMLFSENESKSKGRKMRNDPSTITTETIAESIVRGKAARDLDISPTLVVLNPIDVETVKGRLDLLAQMRGIDPFYVYGGRAVELIDAYNDRVQRGVYPGESATESARYAVDERRRTQAAIQEHLA